MSAQLLVLIVAVLLALTTVLSVALILRGRAHRPELPLAIPLPGVAPAADAVPAAVRVGRPTRLELGDPANPAITITRAPARLRGRSAPVPLTESLANSLSPLLQHAPDLATVVGQAAHSYVLTFAPDVAAGLADGSVRLVQRLGGGIRPMAADAASGQLVEIGWLEPAKVANPATLSLVVWQAMAYITAQHYLFEIDERLGAIESSIAEIKEWLKVDYEATLKSSVQYLQQLRGRLLEGEMTESAIPVLAGRLEDIERESSKIHLALRSHLAGALAEISEQGFHGRRLSTVEEKARQYLRDYERLGQTLLLALLCRGTAAQLSCAFLDRRLSARRIDAIIADSQTYGGFRDEFSRTTRERIGRLSSWLAFERKKRKRRQALLEDLEARSGRLDALAAQLDATAEAARQQLADESHDGSGAVAIAVTLDRSGGITDLRRLLPARDRGRRFPALRVASALS